MCAWAKTTEKMDKVQLYIFSITEKTSIQMLLQYERRSIKKGHIINNLFTSSVRSLQGNLRPRP